MSLLLSAGRGWGGRVGLPACITGHMTRRVCIRGGLHLGDLHPGGLHPGRGSASRKGICIQGGLHPGGGVGVSIQGVCIQEEGWGSASKGSASGGLHPGGRGSASEGWADPRPRALRDMVNKRAVRILLECILVMGFFGKHYPSPPVSSEEYWICHCNKLQGRIQDFWTSSVPAHVNLPINLIA